LNRQAAATHHILTGAAAHIDDKSAREVLKLQMEVDAVECRLREVELEISRIRMAANDSRLRAIRHTAVNS
jgi:hypothetical protein